MNADKMIKMLPDAYDKKETSNNYKMFKLLDKQFEELEETQKVIREYHSLDLAKGKGLDLFGENLGLSRKGLSDEVYRVLLKAKTLRNQGTGAFNNTTQLIAYALDTDITNIRLSEDFETGGRSGYITINNLPLTILNNIGMTIPEYEEMLKDIIPIGLGLSVTNLEGTFSFALGDGTVEEIDAETGFANDEQTTGGTLGATVGNTASYSLIKMPIYGTIELGVVEGVSSRGEYILIDNEVEISSFVFEITADNRTYIFIASKNGLNYWNYSQELTVTAPEYEGTLTLVKASQYISVDPDTRKILIENGAMEYDADKGVIPMTEFDFYEVANEVRTDYKATLNNGVWTYRMI